VASICTAISSAAASASASALTSLGGVLLRSGRAGFGGGGPLLGSRADGFHLGLGGRVGHRLDSLVQPVGNAGDRSASARSARSSTTPVTFAIVTGASVSAGLVWRRRSCQAVTLVCPCPRNTPGAAKPGGRGRELNET
jgi:hypothetical protein